MREGFSVVSSMIPLNLLYQYGFHSIQPKLSRMRRQFHSISTTHACAALIPVETSHHATNLPLSVT